MENAEIWQRQLVALPGQFRIRCGHASSPSRRWTGGKAGTVGTNRCIGQAAAMSLVLCHIQIKEPSDHLLILRAMFTGLSLEENDAGPAQADRDLDLIFLERKFRGRWEKVPDDLDLANWAVSVSDFLAHMLVCLSASSRRRKFGCSLHDM